MEAESGQSIWTSVDAVPCEVVLLREFTSRVNSADGGFSLSNVW